MIGIPFLLYNKVIDADCKSAEHNWKKYRIANPAGRLTGEMKNPRATFLCQIIYIV